LENEKKMTKTTVKPSKFQFRHFLLLGIAANVFFVLYILFCLYYYELYGGTGLAVTFFEVTAGTLETIGFLLMAAAIAVLIFTVQERQILKYCMGAYLVLEVLLMLAEFLIIKLGDWYDSYNPWIIIVHCAMSAAVCMTYMSLDRRSSRLQLIVGIGSAVMLLGMLCIAVGQKIYFSMLANTFAYIYMYIAMLVMLKYDILVVDCYGYKAEVTEYKSAFFDSLETDEKLQAKFEKMEAKEAADKYEK
jgi:hypothetical protein